MTRHRIARPPSPTLQPALSILLLAGLLLVAAAAAPATTTIVVSTTVEGAGIPFVGANEALSFYVEDLVDLGINTYRLWTKMAELEWWDDDDAMDGLWDDSEYGTPTVAQIKADAASGFANTVPWAWWDARFDEAQTWRQGTQVRRQIIADLVANGIQPLVVLRTIDDQGNPDYWPGTRWAPKPPVDAAFLAEWWEHCFAVAYWLNVRNTYGVTHFQVLNEPDLTSQGWAGSQAEYVQLIDTAHDALTYANDLASLPVRMQTRLRATRGQAGPPVVLHAPVVSNAGSGYVAASFAGADPAIEAADFHTYAADPAGDVAAMQSAVVANDTDGVTEPVWVSEWGTYTDTYNTFARAMLTARQLLTFAEQGVEGVTIFSMYDWGGISDANTHFSGLIDVDPEGYSGKRISETYYAFRLMTRALVGSKDRLAINVTGPTLSHLRAPQGTPRYAVTRDERFFYVVAIDAGSTLDVDLSQHFTQATQASLWEYSAAHKDGYVGVVDVAAGQFSFTAPASGIGLARVKRPGATALTLTHFAGRDDGTALRPLVGLLVLLVLLAGALCAGYGSVPRSGALSRAAGLSLSKPCRGERPRLRLDP